MPFAKDQDVIDALLAAVTAEAPRSSLTTGKLDAVRAGFKAGVKPSAIARQFGISQSNIRTALAGEGRGPKIWSLMRQRLARGQCINRRASYVGCIPRRSTGALFRKA